MEGVLWKRLKSYYMYVYMYVLNNATLKKNKVFSCLLTTKIVTGRLRFKMMFLSHLKNKCRA